MFKMKYFSLVPIPGFYGVLISIIWLLPLLANGQILTTADTIKINEVIVRGQLPMNSLGGKILSIDSSMLRDYSHDNISSVISDNTSIFIKNYGAGGIATVSLRGTGAGYTGFSWNGVNINSPMLGQTDLTLIPVGFIDDIKVMYGGTSLFLNSGGIGGIINIETKPSWKNETNLQADISAGSFGRYSTLIKVRTGTAYFQSSTKALFQSFENNFPFTSNFPSNNSESERREHANVRQNSFIQEFYLRRQKSVMSARVWYQRADRNIPVPVNIIQPNPGETQKDEFLRTMLGINGSSGKTDYGTTFSWFSEKQNYVNPSWSINSKNITNMFNLKSSVKTIANEKTTINLIINDDLSIANTVNYDTIKYLNLASLTVSANRIFGEWVGITTLIRQTVKDRNILIPDFMAGFDFRIIPGRDYFIKINLSRNSKVPTLNDLYWNPGGNKKLKNESNYSGEFLYEMNGKISAPLSISAQTSVFVLSIDNMIKWIPGESGLWSPVNINKTKSTGAEANLNLSYVLNSFKAGFNAKYAWNKTRVLKSGDDEFATGKQLIYSPEHLFNSSVRVGYKNYYLSFMSCFTGRRFTSTDNSEYLKGYLINNITSGIKIESGRNTIDINLKAENIFNTNYQAIKWYPMPGRAFSISAIYQFTM